jgi:hypothetical protein
MTRMSKQNERRQQSPRKHQRAGVKTGPKKDKLAHGFKEHSNAVAEKSGGMMFVPALASRK